MPLPATSSMTWGGNGACMGHGSGEEVAREVGVESRERKFRTVSKFSDRKVCKYYWCFGETHWHALVACPRCWRNA
jgi:hypothetical protein